MKISHLVVDFQCKAAIHNSCTKVHTPCKTHHPRDIAHPVDCGITAVGTDTGAFEVQPTPNDIFRDRFEE